MLKVSSRSAVAKHNDKLMKCVLSKNSGLCLGKIHAYKEQLSNKNQICKKLCIFYVYGKHGVVM